MSMPSFDTVWGSVLYESKNYNVLNTIVTNEIKEKISKFRQTNAKGFISAPWKVSSYIYEIEDGKLYFMNYIFNGKKMYEKDLKTFLQIDGSLRLEIKKEKVKYEGKGMTKLTYKDIVFKNGVIKDIQEDTRVFQSLADYIEED